MLSWQTETRALFAFTYPVQTYAEDTVFYSWTQNCVWTHLTNVIPIHVLNLAVTLPRATWKLYCWYHWADNAKERKAEEKLLQLGFNVSLHWSSSFLWFSIAHHPSCHSGANASQTHPRGGGSHAVLQIQTVLQRHTWTLHLHRSCNTIVNNTNLIFCFLFFIHFR